MDCAIGGGIKHKAGDVWGGLGGALVGLPISISLGLAVFGPLATPLALQMGLCAGLIAAAVGGLIVAIFGGAPLSMTGPRAASAVALSGLTSYYAALGIPETNVALAIAACVALAGMLQLIMAALRFDRLIERIPDPVQNGFIIVVGLMIVLDQINPLFRNAFEDRPTVWNLPELAVHAQLHSVALGCAVALLVLLLSNHGYFATNDKHRWRGHLRNAAPVVGLLAGVVFAALDSSFLTPSNSTEFPKALGSALGNFNPWGASWLPHFFGAPMPALDTLQGTLQWLTPIATPALVVAVMGSIDSLSTARELEERYSSAYNSRREVTAQGAANIACALAGGIAVAGTFVRAKASADLGARSRWAAVWAVLFLMVMIFVLWGLVGSVALPVYAGIMTAIGLQMVWDKRAALWELVARRGDVPLEARVNSAIVWFMVLAALLTALALWMVILAGVGLIVLAWIIETSSKLVFRGYSGLHRRSLELRSAANQTKLTDLGHRVRVLELEGDLFFASSIRLSEAIRCWYQTKHSETPEEQYLVIDFSRVHEVDATGVSNLRKVIRYLQTECRVDTWLAYVHANPSLRREFKHGKIGSVCPLEQWTPDTEQALEQIEDRLLGETGHEGRTAAMLWSIFGLPEHHPDALVIEAACQSVTTGSTLTTIYETGAAADSVYFLLHGDVHLEMDGVRGSDMDMPGVAIPKIDRQLRPKRLAVLNPGAVFGVDALIGSQDATRQSRAKTFKASQIMELKLSHLHAMEITHPRCALLVYIFLAQAAARQLNGASAELALVDV